MTAPGRYALVLGRPLMVTLVFTVDPETGAEKGERPTVIFHEVDEEPAAKFGRPIGTLFGFHHETWVRCELCSRRVFPFPVDFADRGERAEGRRDPSNFVPEEPC